MCELRAQAGQTKWTVYQNKSDTVQVRVAAPAAVKLKEHVAQANSECDGSAAERPQRYQI